MSAPFKHTRCLNQMLDANNATQAHLYLEQLFLLPVDIQDRIIEDINSLNDCSSESIASIIANYSIIDLK